MTACVRIVTRLLLCCLIAFSCLQGLMGADSRKAAMLTLGEIKDWPERPWTQAYRHATRHYEIRTNTSYDVARFIGHIMEAAASGFRDIFGYRYGHIPQMPICAYVSHEEYDTLAVLGRAPAGTTLGFYSPQGNGAIHLPYILGNDSRHPSVTLFHEGTHQFVHEVMDFRIPVEYRKHFSDKRGILPSVPIWLNEGLATYMETAVYDGESLEVGRVNQTYLYMLQSMLKSKTNPSIREVVSRRYGQPFSSSHYAMAWGIVYALRHDWDVKSRDENRRRLVKYIEACHKAFYYSPSWDFKNEFLKEKDSTNNFSVRWNTRIGEKSLETFESVVVGPGKTLDAWEEEWTKRILSMNPQQPYGGTKRGKAALDQGDTRFYR